MKISILQEPELEFFNGSHIDTKFGLMNFGPLDKDSPQCPREIKIGVVGTNDTVQSLGEWIKKCEDGILGKLETQKPNLYPPFPGFGEKKQLQTRLIYDPTLMRIISKSEIQNISMKDTKREKIDEAVSLFFENAKYLTQNKNIDIVIFAPPMDLLKHLQSESLDKTKVTYDFHDLLKAKMMSLKKPSQIILPTTYGLRSSSGVRILKSNLQDEATRAWNFYVALYYKAGGIPWRIKRVSADLATCYIGIGFYKTLDNRSVQTSVAQVFNERGEGIILRGGQAKFEKNDKRPFLGSEDAYKLTTEALSKYKQEHKTTPARIVIHKTSAFRLDEMQGFRKAIQEKDIEFFDFISISDSDTKLFRTKQYPPLRGTFLNLDEINHVLYTNGSIDFYQTYPGIYIPKPLSITCFATDQSPKFLAEEILLLTKMNWNNTQFSSSQPITIEAAHKVSNVLKYLEEHEEIEARYSYYM
jgi:hypothetical protein